MKNVCLKSFLLGLVLTLPLSTYSTWVGTIATAHKNNVTIAAAVAGALVATMYAGTGNNEEHAHVLHEWAQTNHGRWFFRLIGAYNNPKRALYAYRLFTIITGALAGTALGYGIAHYFSSGRATDLAQMIVGSVAVHPFVEGKPAVNGKEIIDMSSDYTEFPLYGALNTISHSKEKLTNAHHLAENVLNNTKAEIHEKTTCGELVEKIKVFIKNLVASERTILKDSQFNKEQIIMIERTKAIIAQDKMRWAAHHRANAEREETWQWQRREANRLQAERNTWLRNNLTFQPPWTVTVTIKNKKIKGGCMILFVLALLIPFVIVAENNNAYPFEIMQDKGYAIFDITKSNEYLHRLYCRWSPVLSDAAKIYGKDAADAGAFLLGHCQKDSKTCFSALEVILKLEERLVENDIESSALITNFIKDDIAHNLNGNTAPLERLKELGISPKKYSWNSLEGWLMPQLAKILHDTSKVLGQHALTKEAGSYFLTAYQQSVHDGDNAYSYMKHLKALIKKHPESDELQEYKKCLQEWHNTHISHS